MRARDAVSADCSALSVLRDIARSCLRGRAFLKRAVGEDALPFFCAPATWCGRPSLSYGLWPMMRPGA
eukprot:5334285-Prymnesium_polylepis.1